MGTLGTRLKSLREEKNLTLEQVANCVGTTKVSIGRYEKDEREPKSEMLNLLADFFDVSVDYLLGRTEEQKPSTSKVNMKKEVETIAAHLEGKDITPKKMKLLKSYIDTLFDDFDDE